MYRLALVGICQFSTRYRYLAWRISLKPSRFSSSSVASPAQLISSTDTVLCGLDLVLHRVLQVELTPEMNSDRLLGRGTVSLVFLLDEVFPTLCSCFWKIGFKVNVFEKEVLI